MLAAGVEEDLQAYYRALENKEYISGEDIRKLLEAYRKKLNVDIAFLAEIPSPRKEIIFTHTSVSPDKSDALNQMNDILLEEWDTISGMYAKNWLCENQIHRDTVKSILHCGVLKNSRIVGIIGVADLCRQRTWTDGERLAVQKLGHVLGNTFSFGQNLELYKENEKGMKAQDNDLESIFFTTDCGIMRHSAHDYRILSINSAALRILGYKDADELMADGFDIIAPSVMEEDKPRLRKIIRSLKNVGDNASIEYRVCHKDGTVVDVTGKIKLLEENGELIYQRFLIDYTIQKALEEKKLLNERIRQSELIQALSLDYKSVYLLNLDTAMAVPQRTNNDMVHRFGSLFAEENSMEENIGIYIKEMVYEPDREMLTRVSSMENLRERLNENSSYYVNYRIVQGGEMTYFQMKAVRVGEWKDKHYAVLGFRSVDEEIRSEMRQKKLMEDSYEIIAGLSSDYNFIALINPGTGAMSVYKADDKSPEIVNALADKKVYDEAINAYGDYVYDEDKESWFAFTKLDYILKQLEDKSIYNVNVRNNSKEKPDYIQFTFTKVQGQENEYQLVLAKRIITDIIEKELRQRQLVENALEQAEHANRAKSTFLSNMSHDIRTPMNAIIGFTALATTHIDQKERVQEYLGKIMSSSNHLLSLINDVLDMSRIESGKIELEEKACSLPEILHKLKDILQADIRAKQLELYIDTVDVVNEDICCDRLRLNQVLLNLLSNAVKFTGAGGTISMRIVEKPSTRAEYANFEFHIKDTGIGMSEEFQKHIFEPFERERTSTISGIQGTGLGMAITKNIVDMMGGTISVNSEQGKGTEFVVSLSMKRLPAKKEPQDIPELKGCRALVVDDDFNTCDSVTGMLQQIGMRSEWTMSGREAVLRTRQAIDRGDEYHVYIIDWLMPDMNGIEVTRRIRSEVGNDVPIIVLTAYDWTDIEQEAEQAGVTAFCSKPLFLSELRDCLQRAVCQEETASYPPGQSLGHYQGRILLVEDNELNREIAFEILSEAGFDIETAEDGQVAVDMVKKSSPGYYQLILMDIQMPVMNGYDATRCIRKFENRELAAVPILAMTANAFEDDKQMALDCGMNGHIAKPVDIENLFQELQKILN